MRANINKNSITKLTLLTFQSKTTKYAIRNSLNRTAAKLMEGNKRKKNREEEEEENSKKKDERKKHKKEEGKGKKF